MLCFIESDIYKTGAIMAYWTYMVLSAAEKLL